MNEQQIQLIRQIIAQELANIIKPDRLVFDQNIQILDSRNIQLSRANGTMIGTASDQKIGFFGTTPAVQQGAITKPTGGATVDSEARVAIDLLVNTLKNLGITA